MNDLKFSTVELGILKTAQDNGVNMPALLGFLKEAQTWMDYYAEVIKTAEQATGDPNFREKVAAELLLLASPLEKKADPTQDYGPQTPGIGEQIQQALAGLGEHAGEAIGQKGWGGGAGGGIAGGGGGALIGLLLGSILFPDNPMLGLLLGGLGGGVFGNLFGSGKLNNLFGIGKQTTESPTTNPVYPLQNDKHIADVPADERSLSPAKTQPISDIPAGESNLSLIQPQSTDVPVNSGQAQNLTQDITQAAPAGWTPETWSPAKPVPGEDLGFPVPSAESQLPSADDISKAVPSGWKPPTSLERAQGVTQPIQPKPAVNVPAAGGTSKSTLTLPNQPDANSMVSKLTNQATNLFNTQDQTLGALGAMQDASKAQIAGLKGEKQLKENLINPLLGKEVKPGTNAFAGIDSPNKKLFGGQTELV